MAIDEMCADKMTVDNMPLNVFAVCEMCIDKMTMHEMLVDKNDHRQDVCGRNVAAPYLGITNGKSF
jgi:hypothetical protein